MTGCSLNVLPEEAKAEFELILEAISEGDGDYLKSQLREDIVKDDLDAVLVWIDDFTGGAAYESYSVTRLKIDKSTNTSDGSSPTTYDLDFALVYTDKSMGLHLVLEQYGDDLVIATMRVVELAQSPGELPEFAVADKPTWQKIYLGLMVFIPVFIVFTVFAAIRTRRIHRRPILWPILILIGVGEIELIWATGDLGFSLLKFGLLGAGFVTNNANPGWVMSLYFPLPALWFWYNRMTGKISPKALAEESTSEE